MLQENKQCARMAGEGNFADSTNKQNPGLRLVLRFHQALFLLTF